jgi:hypothetical protein
VRILREFANGGWEERRKYSARRGDEMRRYPHPRVFCVRVANKGLMVDAASRLVDVGFKLAVFSVRCREIVRVAGKGVRERGVCRLEGLKVGMLRTERLR